jgi:HEAT repeat protein
VHSLPIKRARACRCLTAVVLAVGLGMVGCQFSDRLADSLPGSADIAAGESVAASPSSQQQAATDASAGAETPTASQDDVRPVLAQATWFVRLPDRDAAPPSRAPRWRHPGLEDLLSRPPGFQPDFAHWLDDPDPTVAGNAAIAQARLGFDRGAARLAATVRRPELKLAMRRAAVEALGELPAPQSVPELRTLLAQYGGQARRSGGVSDRPELHAELLETFSHLAPADSRPLLAVAVRSSSVSVRLAAVRAWPVDRGGPLPKEVTAACCDSNPRVRAAAMSLIAAQRPENAHVLIQRGLTDEDTTVRLAAVAGLGQLADPPARKVAVGLLTSRNEITRTAAVAALAKMDAGDELAAAAEDKSSRVRRAVATSLGHTPAAAGQEVALRMVQDPNRSVARTMIEAVAQWPLDRAGPVLLAGLTSRSSSVRHAAAEQLASRWPPAAEFTTDELASRKAGLLQSLNDRWTASVASSPATLTHEEARHRPAVPQAMAASQTATSDCLDAPGLYRDVEADLRVLANRSSSPSDQERAVRALVAHGQSLPGPLETIVGDTKQPLPAAVYRQVLPRIDASFEALARLESPDLDQRRKAARSLVDETRDGPLPGLALRRLETLVIPEADASIWWNVELALASDPRPAAVRIHLAALSHPGPEVRRRACRYLAHQRDPRHAAVLFATLDDPSPVVVLAAVVALGHLGAQETAGRASPSPVTGTQVAQSSLDTLPDLDRHVSTAIAIRPLETNRGDLSDARAEERDRQREALEGLLLRRDPWLRLAVAETLTKRGYPSGPAALERLAYDGDPQIRRQVAEKMGQKMGRLSRRTFVATLVRLLDDRHDVRKMALASLQKIVPQEIDVAPDGSTRTFDQQISRWKRWYADQ